MTKISKQEQDALEYKLKKVKKIYIEFCSLIDSLKKEQQEIIQKILNRSEQEQVQKLKEKLEKIDTKNLNK